MSSPTGLAAHSALAGVSYIANLLAPISTFPFTSKERTLCTLLWFGVHVLRLTALDMENTFT